MQLLGVYSLEKKLYSLRLLKKQPLWHGKTKLLSYGVNGPESTTGKVHQLKLSWIFMIIGTWSILYIMISRMKMVSGVCLIWKLMVTCPEGYEEGQAHFKHPVYLFQ